MKHFQRNTTSIVILHTLSFTHKFSLKSQLEYIKIRRNAEGGGDFPYSVLVTLGSVGGHAMSNTSEAIAAKLFARLPGALVIGSKTEHNNYQAMGSDKIVQPVIGEKNDILNFRGSNITEHTPLKP